MTPATIARRDRERAEHLHALGVTLIREAAELRRDADLIDPPPDALDTDPYTDADPMDGPARSTMLVTPDRPARTTPRPGMSTLSRPTVATLRARWQGCLARFGGLLRGWLG